MAKGPQLNVQVSSAALDAIQAAVFVRDLRSPQPLIAPVVEKFAAGLAEDPAIAAAIQLRMNQRQAQEPGE